MARRWKLNVRFAAVLVVGLVVGLSCLMAANSYFRSNVVRALQSRSAELFQQGQWNESASLYRTYIELAPDDTQARVNYAQAVHFGASGLSGKRRAIRLYFEALAVPDFADRSDLRLQLSRLLYETGRHGDAVTQAEAVLAAEPRNAGANSIRSLALYEIARAADFEDSSETFSAMHDTLALHPDFADWLRIATSLATAYRDRSIAIFKPKESDGSTSVELDMEERARLADNVMNELVSGNSDRTEAWLARYVYRNAHAHAEADADLDQALEMIGDSADMDAVNVWLVAGQREQRRAESSRDPTEALASAQKFFERAIEAAPLRYEPYFSFSAVCRQRYHVSGNQLELSPAISTMRKALMTFDANDFALNLELARLYFLASQIDESQVLLKQLDAELAQITRWDDDRRWTQAWIGANTLRARMALDSGNLSAATSRPR